MTGTLQPYNFELTKSQIHTKPFYAILENCESATFTSYELVVRRDVLYVYTPGCGCHWHTVSNDINRLLQPTETMLSPCTRPSLNAAYPHRT